CGGEAESYFQRGNWRVVFPFFRAQEARTAKQMTEALQENRPPLLHLGGLPDLVLNHCLLIFAARENEKEIRFEAWDPNQAGEPVPIIYRRADRTFYFHQNKYFRGGPLNVYEVYRSWLY